MSAVAPGTKFGPYEVTALLGEGGMGAVYRATDTRLGREVAISVFGTIALAPDGAHVATSIPDPQTRLQDIWVFDLVNGGSNRLTFNVLSQFLVPELGERSFAEFLVPSEFSFDGPDNGSHGSSQCAFAIRR